MLNVEVIVLICKLNDINGYEFYGYGNNYIGFIKILIGSDGMVCVLIFCFYEVLIFVFNGGERLIFVLNKIEFFFKGYFYII